MEVLGTESEVVTEYMPLVRHMAGKLARRLPGSVRYDDLVSYGSLGVLGAHRGFDSGIGAKFRTYVIIRIRGAMLDGLRKDGWFSRRNYTKMHVLGLEDSQDGFADWELKIPAVDGDHSDKNRHVHSDLVGGLMSGFNRRERLLMRGMYDKGLTMKQTASTIGVTESRVSQMHQNILARLRGNQHVTLSCFGLSSVGYLCDL